MAKHHPDLIMCRKQPGIAIGRLCEKCDGKCVVCDSYVRPCTLVRICDECNYGSYEGRCVICGGPGISDAYYCRECTQMEKDRDGCPKIVNLGIVEDGPVLRAEEVRLQAIAIDGAPFAGGAHAFGGLLTKGRYTCNLAVVSMASRRWREGGPRVLRSFSRRGAARTTVACALASPERCVWRREYPRALTPDASFTHLRSASNIQAV